MQQRRPDSARPESEESSGPRRWSRRLWPLLFGVIGFGLWIQLLAPGALAESRSADGSQFVVFVHCLPLVALGVGLLWRHVAGRLTVVPLSFVPGLAMLPRAELAALTSTWSLVLAIGTLALYLVVAASRPAGPSGAGKETGQPVIQPSADRHAGAYRWFVATRFGAVAVVFCVVTWALFFAPSIQEALAALEGEDATRSQHLFTAVVVYLVWMVVAYVGAVLPALNWEYYRRRSGLPDSHRALLEAPGRLGRRIVAWLAVSMVVTLLALWLLI